jgi:hypothetical protein
MADKEYLIFCDESDVTGAYFSNFYGGVLVGSSQYDRITRRLNAQKQRLNLFGEVKWSKVSKPYLSKYQALIKTFFDEVAKGHLKVRIMFRQNIHHAVRLTNDQIDGAFFRLYYQFIKHAFGLMYRPSAEGRAKLRLFFDDLPETREASAQFKGYILGLKDNPKIRESGLSLAMEDITEFSSHNHVLAQCLDIVLGAMSFRLNDKHKQKPAGSGRRGKRTIAKEKLFKAISKHIRKIRPGLNIGISTGTPGGIADRWNAPYLHWRFVPSEMEFRKEYVKPKKKNGPAQPT